MRHDFLDFFKNQEVCSARKPNKTHVGGGYCRIDLTRRVEESQDGPSFIYTEVEGGICS